MTDDMPFRPDHDLQLASQANLLRELRISAAAFGNTLSNSFSKGVVEGKRFEDILRSIGLRLSETLLKAAFKPVELGISNLLNEGFKAVAGNLNPFGAAASAGASAGAPMQLLGSVRPFADGGIVGTPTYFGMGRNLGLMGEAGAEAILPLARGPDGKLGVSAGGAGARPVSVTINIATPDVEGFRRSEGQISAAMARAVSRGRRSL
jgi:phage-related minor tail protein